MGCNCFKYKFMETKIEYRDDLIKNELNNNSQYIITTNKQKKIDEINTTILGYPEFVINLINKIRINPKDYANIIEESMKNIVEEESETDSSERTIIYKSEIKVALFKGREAFEEAANELRNMEPMEPLEFREENCLDLPDNIEDYDNSNFLKNKVKEKLENNIHINVFYKERVNIPDISVLLMIVDDRKKKDSGKKRKAILNRDFKYIGITSKYIDNIFIAYFSFSKY